MRGVVGRAQRGHVAGEVELAARRQERGRGGAGRGGRGRGCGGRGDGRRRRGLAAEERHRVGIAGRELQDLAVDLLGLAALLALVEDPGQLLEHRHGLGALIERLERLRQERQRLDVARVGLEAQLELLQRAPRIVLAQVQAGELAVEISLLGAVPQQALGDLDEVVEPVLPAQLLADRGELRDRLLGHPLLRVQLGELDARRDVARIEIDELPDRGQRLLGLALTVEVRRHLLEVLHGVGHQPELPVQLGELEVHLDEPRVELEDLLVDRDGLGEEPLVLIEARDLEVRVGGLLLLALARVQVADLEPHADVLRIFADDAQVLLDRLVDLALLDELAGPLHHLLFVEGHGARSPRRADRIRAAYAARERRADMRRRDPARGEVATALSVRARRDLGQARASMIR
jgi:hypothetical protein